MGTHVALSYQELMHDMCQEFMHNCLEMGTHVALSHQELRRDMGIDQFDCALIVLTKYQEFMHNYILQLSVCYQLSI